MRLTGGEVSTAFGTAVASLGRIGDRLRLTYQAERPSDGRVHDVEVRLRNGGELKLRAPRKVRSPTPEQVATSRVQRLMITERDDDDDDDTDDDNSDESFTDDDD